ncbi:uncharacterized protein [Nicotiana tomentosiformis]|uniref:uncharacterized protein n=1 Tax=Nicotiana tomentosiformis TaxID=4098 RepID=UPI00051C1FEC|nr:uncharacterized protein LOC104112605 [Nicotiana tomentosiformis]XP_018632034.1 uncharacterized protein LOC104112605 [Nicotiana tomentosiformis]
MASLTPGILLKLLQHLDDKQTKVAGEHRAALLQVISIVPSLDDDPWKSRGFYLRVSDSQHSAYVSVSEEDVELILSDKIQLGQFIHVNRLDSGSPVPVLRGVKPVPKRRPCVGDPKDLISSDFLTARSRPDPKRGKKNAEVKRVEAKTKVNRVVVSEDRDIKARRQSIGNGKVEGLEMRRLSLDSVRKGWDRSPGEKNGGGATPRSKSKSGFSGSDSLPYVKKPSFDKVSTPRHSTASISPLTNKNIIVSPRSITKPTRKDLELLQDETLPYNLTKVALSFKNWSDSRISWSSLPSTVRDLGKEVTSYRNVACLSAMHALEEAAAAEGVIQCMSMFAELCESSKKVPAGQLVEQYLNLHENMQKAAAVVKSLVMRRTLEAKGSDKFFLQNPFPEICHNFTNKNAASWIQAAIDSELSNFCLFIKEGKKGNLDNEKSHYVILENNRKNSEAENQSPKNKQSPKTNGPSGPDSSGRRSVSQLKQHLPATRRTNIEREQWFKGSGLKEAAILAEKLLASSRAWFLNFLEDSLNKGFGLNTVEGNSEIAGLLGQLKRVNQWLDDMVQLGSQVDERVEGLRKKLYRFLLDHVDSSILGGK